MRHCFLTAVILGAACAPVFAIDQYFLEPAVPVSPALKAQGGVSTANATGLDALFVNPAAFADNNVSLTFLSLETTGAVSLTNLQDILNERNSLTQVSSILDQGNPLTSLANSIVATGGLGGESSLKAGWVGRNLGVGFLATARMGVRGPNASASRVEIDQITTGVVGMGFPVAVGLGKLQVGLDVRPIQRATTPTTTNGPGIAFGDIYNAGFNLSSQTIDSGFGLGWDVGARWDWYQFKTGLAIRDIGSTLFNFRQYTVSQWLSKGTFPINGSSDSTAYRVPTVIAIGESWYPDVGVFSRILSASLSLDFQIPIKDQLTQTSFWTWTHMGGEVVLIKLLAIRAGLNQGYPTFGLGLNFPYVQFNMAIYSDELGRVAGSIRRPGISTELNIHL